MKGRNVVEENFKLKYGVNEKKIEMIIKKVERRRKVWG